MTYAISIKRDWYGPRTTRSRLIDCETGREWRGTRSEARAKISELDAQVYYTSHNEAGRPVYTIVKA